MTNQEAAVLIVALIMFFVFLIVLAVSAYWIVVKALDSMQCCDHDEPEDAPTWESSTTVTPCAAGVSG